MIRMLVYLIVAGLLFGGGLGASYYLQQELTPAPAEAEAEGPLELPVATRNAPRVPPSSSEDIYRYLETLKQSTRQLEEREAQITREQEQIKLLHEDLRIKQEELEGLHAQVRDALAASEEALRQATAERQALEAMNEALGTDDGKGDAALTPANRQKNIKTIADWIQLMEPEEAGRNLRSMVDEGEMELVIDVLVTMEGRKVADALAAMQDPELVAQITQQVRSFKDQTPPKPKRR